MTSQDIDKESDIQDKGKQKEDIPKDVDVDVDDLLSTLTNICVDRVKKGESATVVLHWKLGQLKELGADLSGWAITASIVGDSAGEIALARALDSIDEAVKRTMAIIEHGTL